MTTVASPESSMSAMQFIWYQPSALTATLLIIAPVWPGPSPAMTNE